MKFRLKHHPERRAKYVLSSFQGGWTKNTIIYLITTFADTELALPVTRMI